MEDLKSLAAEFKIKSPGTIDQQRPVLLMEGQQDLRLIVAHHLQKLGYQKIIQVANGMEALEQISANNGRISVMIAAMDNDIMGGIDLLNEIRENPQYERGPFAISMSSPGKEKIMLATESGVDEILVKPFTLKDIIPKLNMAFKVFHNPLNPEKVYELAKGAFREEKFDLAAKVYQRLADATTNSARPFVGLARVALKQGKADDALKLLEEAEKRNPNYVHLFAMRGEVLVNQNKVPDAIANFRKAIDMSPLNPVRYERAAGILFDQKQYEDGIALLSLALRNEIKFPGLHHFLSQGYYFIREFKKAVKHIRMALAADPQNVTYLNQLGISYKESEEYEEATKVYNSIIKIDPTNKAALYNKAILLHTKGQVDDAVKILQRLVDKNPDFAPAKTKLAEYQKGKSA